MYEFIAGLVTGSILSGLLFSGKKESDAEYHGKAIREDKRRATATLSKDLSHLPPIIGGTASKVELDDRAIWHRPFQTATVGEWNVCLPCDVKVSVGSDIRVSGNSRIRVDGIWHDISVRITKRQVIFSYLLSIVSATALGFAGWSFWELIQLIVTSFQGSVNSYEIIQWGGAGIISMMIVCLIHGISLGLPGLWKQDNKICESTT